MNTTKKQSTKKEKVAEPQEAPSTTLLSSITYTNHEDYLKFLDNLTPEHAVIVLIAAANHSQARGVFSLDESELIAKAIRKFNAQTTEQSQTP